MSRRMGADLPKGYEREFADSDVYGLDCWECGAGAAGWGELGWGGKPAENRLSSHLYGLSR